MKKSLFRGKSTRTKIFTAVTVVAILLLLCVNMLFTYLCGQNQLFWDMTPEGFYTMTDNMVSACRDILDAEDGEGNKKQIDITFCADPDVLAASPDMRPTYFMALQLRNRFSNVSVKTVNLSVNPTAVDRYKTTSRQKIKSTDVIVAYGDKYRVLSGTSMWTSDYFSYNGEYRMVEALASLTAVNKPKAYFVTDHGELYYDPENPESESSLKCASLADLLTDCGLEIRTLKLSEVDAIPEDCVLLIFNNPVSDLQYDSEAAGSYGYISDSEKIDRYLVSHAGSVLFTKDYTVSLPNFEEYASEWGIKFNGYLVKEEERYLTGVGEEGSAIIATYDKDEQSYGYAYYGDYSALSSAPQMIFTNTGFISCSFPDGEIEKEPGTENASREYAAFIGTTDKASAYDYGTDIPGVAYEGYMSLCAASVRSSLDAVTADITNSYFFCANSADFLSNELLGNEAYANYSVMSTVINNLSRTDRFADMILGGLSGNSPSYGGKQTVSTSLSEETEKVYTSDTTDLVTVVKINYGVTDGARAGITLFVCAIPVAVLVLGIAVFIKRKFL